MRGGKSDRGGQEGMKENGKVSKRKARRKVEDGRGLERMVVFYITYVCNDKEESR